MIKKAFFIILVLSLFLIFVAFIPKSSAVAYANDNETEEDLEDTVTSTLDDLDLSSYQSFIDELEKEDNISIKQLINDILHNKNQIDFNYFYKFALGALFKEFKNILPKLAIIISVVLLFGVLQKLVSNFNKQSTKKIVFISCYGVVLSVLLYMVSDVIMSTIKTINILSKFVDLTFPILLTLVTALGGNVSVSVYQPLVLVFSGGIFKIITLVVLPLFYICFVFGIIGNLSDDLKLSKFAKTAKKTAEWVLGIVFSLFITFLTAQGITGASFDSIAAKGAKFALSSYVPVVGNYLKEGFDIILAGCLIIKNAFGLCAIIILIFIILLPIIKLLLIVFGLRLTSSILEPVSDSKFSEVLYCTSDSLMILVTILVCVFFALFIFIMLIIYSCNMGVI